MNENFQPDLLRVAFSRARNTQQNRPESANADAMSAQQVPLKALAQAVLTRNRQRNSSATEAQKPIQQTAPETHSFVASKTAESSHLEAGYDAIPEGPDQPFAERELEAVRGGYAVLTCLTAIGPDTWVYVVRDEERKGKLSRKTTRPVYTLGGIEVLMRQPIEDIRRLHGLKAAFNGTLAADPGADNELPAVQGADGEPGEDDEP